MDLRRPRKNVFPWRPGNRFTLLVDGPQFFPRMLAAIDAARSHVLLEIYLFESGAVAERFIAALTGAAGRGVAVKLLLDAYGAHGLQNPDRARLPAGGVDVRYYNPLRIRQWLGNMFRDHRKLLVVDGAVAYTSGAGITDEFHPAHDPAHAWRETTVEARGPVVADWQRLFLRNWEQHTGEAPALPAAAGEPLSDGMTGRVVISSALAIQDIKRSLYTRVRRARKRVWIETAYFVPSRKVLRALQQAAARGVDVRLLLPGQHTDHPGVRHAGRRFYGRLLKRGVRIFEYQPRFLHAKTVLADDWVSIGSSNLDRWNLRWNLEANQEIESEAFAAEVAVMFERDFAESRELHHELWRQRPLRERMRERWWGQVDAWLESIGRRRGARRRAPTRSTP
jgi:phosphatidylserine/phosphatidylglycerophosphate/cardiolipin synthase-like enzyme